MKNKIINYLNNILDINIIKVQLDSCEVIEIDETELEEFESRYNLYGYKRGCYNLAIKYNGKIVLTLNVGQSERDSNYGYEIYRLTYSEYRVIGGVKKLLLEMIQKYDIENLVVYCDRSKFTGETYIDLGFQLISYEDVRSKFIIHKGNNVVIIEKEDEVKEYERYFEVYDCGGIKYGWKK